MDRLEEKLERIHLQQQREEELQEDNGFQSSFKIIESELPVVGNRLVHSCLLSYLRAARRPALC